MKFKSIPLLALLLTGVGCASIHSGNPQLAPEDLWISATIRTELSTPYFTLVEFTFENKSPSWISVKQPSLDLGDPRLNEAVIVVSGTDLKSWGESMELRKNIKDKNLQTFMGSLGLLGLIGRSFTKNKALKDAEGLIGISALGALSVSTFKQSLERARDVAVLPETHLYANDLRIAPGLFLRRWVVFYSPSEHWMEGLGEIGLHYLNTKGSEEKLSIPFIGGHS